MSKLKKLFTLALVALGITAFAPIALAEYTDNCITFSSAKSFSLKVASEEEAWDGTMFISPDKTDWSMWTGQSAFAAQTGGAGDYYLYVRGDAKNTTITADDMDNKWVLDVAGGGKVACSGNIETLRGATGNDPSSTAMAEGCYEYLFMDCEALTSAPALPATTLAKQCYRDTFCGCTSLTAAPVLPATTLEEECYMEMFMGCSSLTAAPALPATTLTNGCYAAMFSDCTSLTAAPALPATTLAESCYEDMFDSCTSLTDLPALNATMLAKQCYFGMFEGCTSLTDMPELPATTLAESCYEDMFYDCSALEVNAKAPGKEWKLPSAETAKDWNLSMLHNTKGDVEEPALDTTYYIASAVPAVPSEVTVTEAEGATAKVYTNEVEAAERPAMIKHGMAFDVVYTANEGWMFPGGYQTFTTNLVADVAEITVSLTDGQKPVAAKACADCLAFSADAAFGIKMWKKGTPAEPNLEYSTDKIYWSKFDLENGATAGADHTLYLRGTNNTAFAKDSNYYTFTNTADSAATAIACSGNTLALLDYETVAKGGEPMMDKYAFLCLFNGFAALTAAPELPATNVTQNCYSNMFAGCTSLTAAPALPATTLAGNCYDSMFFGCTALTDVPDLPSTSLSERCYRRMFYGCTALVVNTNAPGKAWSIPKATATREGWSTGMFRNTSGNIADMSVKDGVTYYVVLPVKIEYVAPKAVENATFKVCMDGEEVTDGQVWSNRTDKAESPADPVARVVYTANPGYAFEDGTTEKSVAFDTRVNPAVLAGDAPAPAGKSELVLGVVAQRYPWNGVVDVNYKATYWSDAVFGAVEIKCGDVVVTNALDVSKSGEGVQPVDLKAIFGEKAGEAQFEVIVSTEPVAEEK